MVTQPFTEAVTQKWTDYKIHESKIDLSCENNILKDHPLKKNIAMLLKNCLTVFLDST